MEQRDSFMCTGSLPVDLDLDSRSTYVDRLCVCTVHIYYNMVDLGIPR